MDLFLKSVFALVTWRWAVSGLILDLNVSVSDLEMNRIWTDY